MSEHKTLVEVQHLQQYFPAGGVGKNRKYVQAVDDVSFAIRKGEKMCIRDRYWVGMARIVRSQILILKESEYVTAARALGASSGRIIKKHLLTNCIGTLIVTTTLQIPASIFTESYLSFIGLGVAAPLPSLGSLATDAVKGMNTYPHLLIAPAVMISVMILVFNLFGDGLRDAFEMCIRDRS